MAFACFIFAVLLNPFISVIVLQISFISKEYIHQIFAFIGSVLFFYLSLYLLFLNEKNLIIIRRLVFKVGLRYNRMILVIFIGTLIMFLNYYLKPQLYVVAFLISNDLLLLLIKYTVYFFIFLEILFLIGNAKIDWLAIHFLALWLFLVICFFSMELVFRYFLTKEKVTSHYSGKSFRDYMQVDKVTGEKLKPGIIPNVKITPAGETICNVRYSIDALSRRITIDSSHNNPSQHLLFWGESWIFGDGLNDDQTLPSIVACNTNKYNVYNYGFIASGPQYALAKIASGTLQKEIKNQRGIAVFHFNYSTQIERLYGSLRVLNYSKNYFFYDMTQIDFPKKGTLLKDQPKLFNLLFQLSETNLAKALQLNLPIITDYQLERSVEFIKKIEVEYLKIFPGNQFYVLIYPCSAQYKVLDARKRKIIKLMLKNRIRFLDYSKLFIPEEAFAIRQEGHPNYKANSVIAKALIKDLLLK